MEAASYIPTQSLAFTLDFQCSEPFELIREIEKQANTQNCVMHLQSFISGKYICTFKEEAICRHFLSLGEIHYRGKYYHVKPADSNVVTLRVRRLPRSVYNESVVSVFSGYGKVFHVVREKVRGRPDITTGHRIVMMELTKDLPYAVQICNYWVDIELC